MALQMNHTFNNGVVATECYVKLLGVDYIPRFNDNDESGLKVQVGFYFNEAARTASDNNDIKTIDFVIEDTSIETRAAQYAYLKTLDIFSEAVDV